jgi:hypothetical protein
LSAHELDFRAILFDASEAELPEPQYLLDPGLGRLHDGLAPAVLAATLIGLQFGRIAAV